MLPYRRKADGAWIRGPRRALASWLVLALLGAGAAVSLPACGGEDLVIPGSAPVVTPSDQGGDGNGSDENGEDGTDNGT